MRRGSIVLTSLCSLFLLSGCGTYSTHFDCPLGEGMKCASLSSVNKKMDKSEISVEKEETSKKQEATDFYLSPEFKETLEE